MTEFARRSPPTWANEQKTCVLIHGRSEDLVSLLPDNSIDLVLTDPPWNTGHVQRHPTSGLSYPDAFADLQQYLLPVVEQCYRVLRPGGTLLLQMSIVESARTQVLLLDDVFGRHAFLGEILPQQEAGGGGGGRFWPQKHTHVLAYYKAVGKATNFFDATKTPRVPRKALKPGYEIYKGSTAILDASYSTTHPERIGYPSQKPSWLYATLMEAHCKPGGVVLDPYCGSGTTGSAALATKRTAILFDQNIQGVVLAAKRLGLKKQPDEEGVADDDAEPVVPPQGGRSRVAGATAGKQR